MQAEGAVCQAVLRDSCMEVVLKVLKPGFRGYSGQRPLFFTFKHERSMQAVNHHSLMGLCVRQC